MEEKSFISSATIFPTTTTTITAAIGATTNEVDSITIVPTTTTSITVVGATTNEVDRSGQNINQGTAFGFLKNVSSLPSASDIEGIDEDLHDKILRRIAYPLCTPDNIRLRMLLNKVLTNSDVAHCGKILVPKKKAEQNFPKILQKEGMLLVVRDVHSDQEWTFKYKYWANNNSRMYVLEHTGFVKQYGLEAGDTIYFYRDEWNKMYVSAEKVATQTRPHMLVSGSKPTENFAPMNFNHHWQEEEEEVMMMLIQQLKFKEQEQACSNASLLHMFDFGSSSSFSNETLQSYSAPKFSNETPQSYSAPNRRNNNNG